MGLLPLPQALTRVGFSGKRRRGRRDKVQCGEASFRGGFRARGRERVEGEGMVKRGGGALGFSP